MVFSSNEFINVIQIMIVEYLKNIGTRTHAGLRFYALYFYFDR